MNLDRFILIAQALSDPSRVRAMLALRGGELCACQLVELLDLAPSTVSRHMALLRQAGLIEARKDGRWMHYRLAEGAFDGAAAVFAQSLDDLAASEAGAGDAKRLDVILSIEPEALCEMQRNGIACCSSAPAPPAAARWRKDGPGPSEATSTKPSRRGSNPKA